MPTRVVTEFSFTVDPKPGELSRILLKLSEEGVNVIAFCGFNEGDGGQARIMIVPDKEPKARKAAEKLGLHPQINSVVAVTGEAGKGAGAKLAGKLLDAEINIQYTYASTPHAGESTAIFKVEDPDAAIAALKRR